MTTVWLGTAGWSYFPDWLGPFYPAGTRPADALARYAEAFRFVEIDSTFYAAPAPETVASTPPAVPTRSNDRRSTARRVRTDLDPQ